MPVLPGAEPFTAEGRGALARTGGPGVARDIAKPGVEEVAYDRVPVRAAVSLADLWRATRRDLARVTQPLLDYRSREDHVVEPLSWHVPTLDHDAEAIAEGTLEFVVAHAAAGRKAVASRGTAEAAASRSEPHPDGTVAS